MAKYIQKEFEAELFVKDMEDGFDVANWDLHIYQDQVSPYILVDGLKVFGWFDKQYLITYEDGYKELIDKVEFERKYKLYL